jgi:hypothetical protein
MIAIIYFILAVLVIGGWIRHGFIFLFTSKYAIIGWIILIYVVIRIIWFPEVCHICLDDGYIDGK